MGLELSFEETMSGEWTRTGGGSRPISLRASARFTRLEGGSACAQLDGTLLVDGLASDRAATGTLVLAVPARELRYDLAFRGDDEAPYRLVGHKAVRLLSFLSTMTTLPAQILDETGAEVGRCTLRFDLGRELLPLLASVRVRRQTG